MVIDFSAVGSRARLRSRSLSTWFMSSSWSNCRSLTTSLSIRLCGYAMLWTHSPSPTHSAMLASASSAGVNNCRMLPGVLQIGYFAAAFWWTYYWCTMYMAHNAVKHQNIFPASVFDMWFRDVEEGMFWLYLVFNQRNKMEEAVQLARLSEGRSHFSHSLEWLLFTVFDSAMSRYQAFVFILIEALV